VGPPESGHYIVWGKSNQRWRALGYIFSDVKGTFMVRGAQGAFKKQWEAREFIIANPRICTVDERIKVAQDWEDARPG
jgi:hypothetical protein